MNPESGMIAKHGRQRGRGPGGCQEMYLRLLKRVLIGVCLMPSGREVGDSKHHSPLQVFAG